MAQHGASSVHRHDRAVDEARLRREEVSDDRRHLLGLADASERMQVAHLLVDLLAFCDQRLIALGSDRSQSDGVGADSDWSVVDGKRAP